MDVFEAVRTILAVRRYQDGPVPEDTLRRILEAGRLTGSAMNGQPWHFIVVQDRETLRRLGALAQSGPYVAQAPLAIVVAVVVVDSSAPAPVANGSWVIKNQTSSEPASRIATQ